MNDAWPTAIAFIERPLFAVLLSLALAAIGVVLTIRSQRARKPRWAIRSNNLISGFATRLSALEIKYADRKVENLTISKVLFWNAGAETINRSDVADADLLRIAPVGSVTLLDFGVLKINNEASQFAVVGLPDGTAGMAFDFLDQGQGAVIQVIHTGRSSSDLVVRGTVKGAGATRKRDIKTYRSRLYRWLDFAPNVILFGVTGAIGVYAGYRSSDVKLLVGGAAGLLLFVAYIAWKYWDARLPRGLEDYARD